MKPVFDANGQAGDDRTLNHRMRIVQEDQVILAGARLAFVAVDQTYFGLADCLGTNDHFMPVGKPAPPRPRRLEAFISLMIHSGPCARHFLHGLVAAELDVLVDVGCAQAEAPGDDLHFIGMRDESRHSCGLLSVLACARYSARMPGPFRRQIIVEVVVDLDGRGPAARADALHFFQREHAVGRHPLWPMPSFVLERSKSRRRRAACS